MRAKYASAIRDGILKGRQTRYGDLDDPYYKLRSEIIWGYFGDSTLRELTLKAFEHTWETETATRMEGKTPEERREAERNFERVWEFHTESREEKQLRLLREEVDSLSRRVRALGET